MKRGKRYTDAAKTIDRTNLYEAADAISLVKKNAVSEPDAMDVMQISRSVVQLYCLMELVKQSVFLYLPRMQKLMRHWQQELIL